MKKLLSALLSRLDCGENAVLCSILASSGSSPRGAGAKMAVFSDGTTLGTIGGGAVELYAAKQAQHALHSGVSSLRAFDLSPDQVNSIGMVCGGAVTVYFQILSARDRPVLQKWLTASEDNRAAWLYLAFSEKAVSEFSVLYENELPGGDLFGTKAKFTGQVYTEPICIPGRVYIFGGGHVGAALAPVLASVDFRVTVFDNRPAFSDNARLPGAERVILGDYHNIFDQIELTKDDYAVIMTPGHQADYDVLAQVLRTDAAYIGCIGSKKKAAHTNEQLLAQGLSENDLARIHSPIGLDILAETPAEIAVSIAAELIRVRKERL